MDKNKLRKEEYDMQNRELFAQLGVHIKTDAINKIAELEKAVDNETSEEEKMELMKKIEDLHVFLNNYKHFNKGICLSNIRYLLSKNPERKIGQIEREANVQLGYMSRLEKQDNSSDPSVEFVVSAARTFGVSVDSLIGIDMQKLTPAERYTLSFMDKLKKDTLEDKLDWNIEPEDVLNYPHRDKNGNPTHPLLSVESFYEEDEMGEGFIERVTFLSKTYGPRVVFSGESYNLDLKDGTKFYLMSIEKSYHKRGDSSAYAKEAWMYSPVTGKQFLFSSKDGTELSEIADPLYELIQTRSMHPKLNKDIKAAMDAFLSDDLH